MVGRSTLVAGVVLVATFTSPVTAARADTAGSDVVKVCGTKLCLGGISWRLHGGTVYGHSSASDAVNRAKALRLNTIRLTDWLDVDGSVQAAPFDETRWRKVDADLTAAKGAGIRVILDLSTYRNLLVRHSINPYTYDWKPFLNFVVNRRNSVNGVRYGSDPTIALVSFAGEVEPINASDNRLGVTTQQVTDFFRIMFAFWATNAPQQLKTTGGFLQLDWNSGIDWKAIMALPGSNVCSIHVYSSGDQNITLPAVADYCRSLGKPWITEEFGQPVSLNDSTRAAWYQKVYDLQQQRGSAGAALWNVGPQTVDSYDVNPQTPLTFATVQRNAP